MSDTRQTASVHSDLVLGVALVALGVTAAWMASGFDAASGPYPLALGILIAASGLVLAIRTLAGQSDASASFGVPATVGVPTAMILAAWIAALAGGLGFILPTFLMQAALMLLGGVRGILRASVFAAFVTVAAYALFVLALDVRLPRPVAPWLY